MAKLTAPTTTFHRHAQKAVVDSIDSYLAHGDEYGMTSIESAIELYQKLRVSTVWDLWLTRDLLIRIIDRLSQLEWPDRVAEELGCVDEMRACCTYYVSEPDNNVPERWEPHDDQKWWDTIKEALDAMN